MGAKRPGSRGETIRLNFRGETTRGETTRGEMVWGRNVLLPLKTSAYGLDFQHLPRDLANVNAWKTMFDPYNERMVIFKKSPIC